MKVARRKERWLESVIGYTLAGTLSSAVIGFAISSVGSIFLPASRGVLPLACGCGVAVLAIVRDNGFLRMPLPQVRRQTSGMWAKRFGARTAAVLWGLDLGVTFTTWVTFSGIWVIAVIAFTSATPAVGVSLFLAYWLGRALSVWTVPLLGKTPNQMHELLHVLNTDTHLFARINTAAATYVLTISCVWLLWGVT